MPDVTTTNFSVEFRTRPIQMTCPVCGNRMRFVSDELGHSCSAKECLMHIEETVDA